MTAAEAKTVEQIAARLSEDWECVQILVSRAEGDSTGRYFCGLGNWFGRQGMAHDFVKTEETRSIVEAINPPEDQ